MPAPTQRPPYPFGDQGPYEPAPTQRPPYPYGDQGPYERAAASYEDGFEDIHRYEDLNRIGYGETFEDFSGPQVGQVI